MSVSGTGSILTCNIELPTKNERVIREKTHSISPEYKTISEKVARKVQIFKDLQQRNKLNELTLRKNCSVVIANSLNKVILLVTK